MPFSFCLFFGVLLLFSMPSPARADFFSSIFGDEVHAQTTIPDNATESDQNSQTMTLLQANIVSILGFPGDKIKNNQIDENANINIVSDNAILPVTGPLGVSNGKDVSDSSSDTSVYVIRKGDSLTAIADMFGVSINTILSANDIKKGDKLVEGDVLFILPISGLEHTVAKGETLQSIAKLYKVDINDIASYNGITQNATLTVGDNLMVPGGEMADEGGDKPAPDLGAVQAKDQNYYVTHPIQNVAGYFINPLPTGRKTQGLHGPGHRGIDIGAPKGTPIYASASGVISLAHSGWSGGYGNMVIIQHPNGTKTLYAHMSKLGTKTGDRIKQGRIIGYVGSTGHSTGPHLHFEVFNAKNPGTDWSWKQ